MGQLHFQERDLEFQMRLKANAPHALFVHCPHVFN